MIGNPPEDKTALFEGMLAAALRGEPPPTESGLGDAVISALYLVVAQKSLDSITGAQTAFDQSQ